MPRPSPQVEDALRAVRLLAFDVDGTLTDGRVVYLGEDELQSFCVHDGQGLAWLRREGLVQAWISGRGCEATRRRAKDLGVDELHLGAGPKEAVLAGVQERLGIGPDETLAMGDDLPDLALARRAALFAAPSNARVEVREHAQLRLQAAGGYGAARELAESILRARGLWDPKVNGYVHGDA